MKKLGIVSLIIFLFVIGIYIFNSKQAVKISELGEFRAVNVDFSFLTLDVLDESSNEILVIDFTHDIRKYLTDFLLT